MRRAGHTLEEIATHFGITRERARQILIREGAPSAEALRSKRESELRASEEDDRKRVIDLLEVDPGLDLQEVSSRLGLSKTVIRRLAPSHVRRLTVTDDDRTLTPKKKWDASEILEAIRSAATFEFPLSAVTYGNLVGAGEVHGPSVPLIYLRYGSWTAACASAGVESGVSPLEGYESRWTDDDLLRSVATYLWSEESPGTFAGYDVWSRAQGEDVPSAGTIRARLGGWNPVKRRALRPNESADGTDFDE